jgi:hypothetical protein
MVLSWKNGPLTKSDCPVFKFLRADVTQITMSALSIVKAFDVFEHRSSRFISRSESNPVHAFPIEQPKETLHNRIIVAVSTGTHAALNPMAIELVSKVITRILGAPIRMMDQIYLRIAVTQSH